MWKVTLYSQWIHSLMNSIVEDVPEVEPDWSWVTGGGTRKGALLSLTPPFSPCIPDDIIEPLFLCHPASALVPANPGASHRLKP